MDFTGRVVVDVGAGSGILSLFAAQVYSALFDQLSLCFIILHFWFWHTSSFLFLLMIIYFFYAPYRLVLSMFMLWKHLKWQNMLAS